MKRAEHHPALVNIGFGNVAATERIVAVVSPAGAPMKRLRDHARQNGLLVDATEGRRTRSVIIMDSGHVILSSLLMETISERVEEGKASLERGDEKA